MVQTARPEFAWDKDEEMSEETGSKQPEAQAAEAVEADATGLPEAELESEPVAAEATVDATEQDPAQAEIAVLREELAAAQAQTREYLDRLQRTSAEFQNSRRRQERALDETIERANRELLRRLLPVLDDLNLAFAHAPSSLATTPAATMGAAGEQAEGGTADAGSQGDQSNQVAWIDGFRQIRRKLLDLLADQGVTVIDTSGEFDPTVHEAIGSEPSDSVPSGHIIAALRTGYAYKGQVLRPALVRVAM